ncbi:hypothetical protein E1288_37265 [Saccharopolyspora elongata]|uniref:Uncharacterized protein n=1 Tax=Saccharopolyspora elongata TaxID=2530387 RepID=A0A4R4Y6S0_9PSEU|nr:hypothetical protein E1288_37265 [Saccharopolyspora elongata]
MRKDCLVVRSRFDIDVNDQHSRDLRSVLARYIRHARRV